MASSQDVGRRLTSLASLQKTVTTSGTAERLTASSTPSHSITIKALAGNTNNVYVGGSDVSTSNGFVLDASDTLSLDIVDIYNVWLDVDTDGEGVSVVYIL